MNSQVATFPAQQFGPVAHYGSGIMVQIRALVAGRYLPQNPEGFPVLLNGLLSALGWQGDTRTLLGALKTEHAAYDMADLLNLMAILGYKAQKVTISGGMPTQAFLPCLYHAYTGAPLVALMEEREGGVIAIDGVEGKTLLVDPESLKGTLYYFERILPQAVDHSGDNAPDAPWFSLVMQRFTPLIWQLGIYSFFINAVALAVPFFVIAVYDQVIGARTLSTLPYLLFGVLLAVGLEIALRMQRVQVIAWISARMHALVSVAVFERLLNLAPTYTERSAPAAQLARFKAFESVRDFFSGPLFPILIEVPFALILLGALGLIAIPLLWVPLLATLSYGIILLITRRGLKATVQRSGRASSNKQQFLIEAFSKWQMLHLGGLVTRWKERFGPISASHAAAQFQSGLLGALIEDVLGLITVLGGIGTLIVGVYQIWAGNLTPGALVAAMILTWRGLAPLQQACAILPRMQQVNASIQQINRLMTIAPEREAVLPSVSLPPLRGNLGLVNVSLRYPRQSSPVFYGVNLSLAAGETAVIVGENGSGKSSLLKLLNGMQAVTTGSVRFDGSDIRQLDPLQLRQRITYLPQSPDFFSGTILENLQMVKPEADEKEIYAALADAGVLDEIEHLPHGLHTPLGASGANFAESTLFRIGLARAYLHCQPVMICDELPYSVLSSPAGQKFREFIIASKGVRTVVFVTHRQDFLALADQAVYLRTDRTTVVAPPSQIIAIMEKNG